jgi:hypothetical protein
VRQTDPPPYAPIAFLYPPGYERSLLVDVWPQPLQRAAMDRAFASALVWQGQSTSPVPQPGRPEGNSFAMVVFHAV